MEDRRSVAQRQARGRELLDGGRTGEAIAYLRAAAADLAEEDGEGAATILVDAVQPALFMWGPERARDLAEEAAALARGTGGASEIRAVTRLGDAHAWAGDYSSARGTWAKAAAIGGGGEPSILCERANALLRAGELDRARTVAYEAIVRARQAESRADLLDALAIAHYAEVHLGNLHEGLALAEQAMAATEGESGIERVDAVAGAAWVAALLGDVERVEAALRQTGERIADLRLTAPGGFVAGMLALGRGRFQEAADAFESKLTEAHLPPMAQALSLRPFVPSLVEAYVRLGRIDEAQALVDQFADAAVATEQPRVAAPALRARGAAYEDEAAFAEALRWHERWGNRFEEGRTLLARGELLRRRKQWASARHDLTGAIQRFAQVGASTWRERAATELRAAGDRTVAVPAPIAGVPEELSQQEAAIVKLVAEGLSNREVATRLFLSVKTVEGHLTTIYGKLGIRSRGQLLAALLGDRRGKADQS